ncbi:MAG TPA: hypothetical protein VG602_09625 [Actinomycetota bacterium]|nr:hypothetical protein [Actinomycetota bacterium]
MRTGRLPGLLAPLALVLAFGPVAAAQEGPPPIDCGPGDGREQLTTQGFAFEFDAPMTGGNTAASDADTTGTVWANRTATFPFENNFAPHVGATLKATLSWANNPHDFDLYVRDDESGGIIAGSENFNQTDPTGEELTVDVAHCQDISILVRNWVGGPAVPLKLNVAVTPSEQLLACAEGDPAPGCAGKTAGQAPDFVPDNRARLFFGGSRPGMVAAALRYAYATGGAGEPPMHQALVSQRPTAGVPNSQTRLVHGNYDFGPDSPFFPYFETRLAAPVTVSGPIHVLAWLSSRTMVPTDKLWFDLHIDGALVKRVEVTNIGAGPKPVLVTFDGYDATEAMESVTVGITSPRAYDAPPTDASYAEWTLFYDSVQYQSRVTFPFPQCLAGTAAACPPA